MTGKSTAERIRTTIRLSMVEEDLSQKELADAIGMSQPALSRRLAGEVPWNVPELERVAKRFGVDTSDLLKQNS